MRKDEKKRKVGAISRTTPVASCDYFNNCVKLSVDHDDPGNGTKYNGCIMFGCDHPKYAKMIKKEILKHMKERRKHR